MESRGCPETHICVPTASYRWLSNFQSTATAPTDCRVSDNLLRKSTETRGPGIKFPLGDLRGAEPGCPLFALKRTSRTSRSLTAYDPKRAWVQPCKSLGLK